MFNPHASEQSTQIWLRRFLAALLLGGQVLFRIVLGKIRRRNLMEHLITAGPHCLISVVLTTYFSGMIFTIQTARELVRFGAVEQIVGGAFALAFCRELAPILSACVLAGQVGSAFAAEIGAMRVTEQIDALQMLKTDPIEYLVVPRVVACCLMLPVLTIIALVVGILGGVFAAATFYNVSPGSFMESVRMFLQLWDLLSVIIKSVIFGAIVAVIGCSWGLTTTGGVKGVGRSATAAVVTAWVCIFIVNFFLSLALFQELGIVSRS